MSATRRLAAVLGTAALALSAFAAPAASAATGAVDAGSLGADVSGLAQLSSGPLQNLDLSGLSGKPSESFKLAIVAEANRARAEHGLPPLAVDATMSSVTQAWTDHVVADVPYPPNVQNGHNYSAGSQIRPGFTYGPGEICGGHSANTPRAFVDGWLASKMGHREALLDPNFNTVGVGASNYTVPALAYGCLLLAPY